MSPTSISKSFSSIKRLIVCLTVSVFDKFHLPNLSVKVTFAVLEDVPAGNSDIFIFWTNLNPSVSLTPELLTQLSEKLTSIAIFELSDTSTSLPNSSTSILSASIEKEGVSSCLIVNSEVVPELVSVSFTIATRSSPLLFSDAVRFIVELSNPLVDEFVERVSHAASDGISTL